MNIVKTEIDGVLIIEPRLFRDARGYFFESFSEREFEEKVSPILGHSVHFCQDNESMSSYGVMRGLHFQRPPYTQSKLVRCVKGRVLDVAVDIRKGSPTYGKHVAVELTEDNHVQFFIPKGFAHGFAETLEEVATSVTEEAWLYNEDTFNIGFDYIHDSNLSSYIRFFESLRLPLAKGSSTTFPKATL